MGFWHNRCAPAGPSLRLLCSLVALLSDGRPPLFQRPAGRAAPLWKARRQVCSGATPEPRAVACSPGLQPAPPPP
eukprot:1901243-Prymnesium_polylepis.1